MSMQACSISQKNLGRNEKFDNGFKLEYVTCLKEIHKCKVWTEKKIHRAGDLFTDRCTK